MKSMNAKLFLALLLITTFLTACASQTYYKASDGESSSSYGYRDQKLEENKYRVSFLGRNSTQRETAELYLLYRAAEITSANGYEYFVMVHQETEPKQQTPSSSFFGGLGFGGRGTGVGLGYGVPSSSTSSNYQAVAIISLYKTKPPEPQASYNAKEVLANLEPKIVRPPEK